METTGTLSTHGLTTICESLQQQVYELRLQIDALQQAAHEVDLKRAADFVAVTAVLEAKGIITHRQLQSAREQAVDELRRLVAEKPESQRDATES